MRRAAAGVICLSVVLAVAGCGSDEPDTNSGSPSETESTQSFTPGPKPTGTPVKIGVVATETGPTAGPYSGIPGVAKAWAAWVNEAEGGLNGHPVELVYADDQGAPATATSAVRKMVENDGVVAVFLGSSVGSSVVADYLAEKGIAEISADQGQRAPDGPTSWFTTDLGMPAVAEAAADVAKDAGYDSVAAAVCSEVPACGGIGDLMDAYSPKIDVEYKGLITIAGSATSATAQCLEIVNSGAEAVAAFIGLNAALKIIQTCQGQGYTGGYVQLAWADSIISELPGEQFGVLYSFPWWSEAAPVAEYRSVIEQYESGTDYKASGSGTLWAQLSLFKHAMESGPAEDAKVSGADVIAAFRTVKDETLDGLLPQPITYSEEENTTINCFWPVKHEDGTYETLQGDWTSGNGASGDLASQCTSS